MRKREIFLLSSTVFSLGIVLGFMLSPIKKGITVYGGDSTSNHYAAKNSKTDENNSIHQ